VATIDATAVKDSCLLRLLLDSNLHLLSLDISDSFPVKLKIWPDSLRAGPNPPQAEWREAWLVIQQYEFGL